MNDKQLNEELRIELVQRKFSKQIKKHELFLSNGCSGKRGIFKYLDLSGFSFQDDHCFSESIFMDCDLSSTNFSGAAMYGCLFLYCNLRYSEFIDAKLSGSAFRFCDMDNVSFIGAEINRLQFYAVKNGQSIIYK